MRRVLGSLLVFVMTFALVARGVAAPLMHLHPDVPATAAEATVSIDQHDHAGCNETVSDEDVAHSRSAGHAHDGSSKNSTTPEDHGKVCDTNGACCGPLVLIPATDTNFGHFGLPEPLQFAASAGAKPRNPDRPPSPRIA